jgi:sec-independent protein translocase protein TatA
LFLLKTLNTGSFMGFHGVSIGSLIIIGLIAVLLFGPKRLRTMAEDLGIALRNFNKALHAPEETSVKESKSERSVESGSS